MRCRVAVSDRAPPAISRTRSVIIQPTALRQKWHHAVIDVDRCEGVIEPDGRRWRASAPVSWASRTTTGLIPTDISADVVALPRVLRQAPDKPRGCVEPTHPLQRCTGIPPAGATQLAPPSWRLSLTR